MADFLLNGSKDPCSSAKTNELEDESDVEKDIADRIVDEEEGEGRGSILPRNGGKDGGHDSSLESIVEEGLGGVRNAENVVALTRNDGKGGEGSDQEEGSDNSQLTSNHKSRQVLSIAPEQKVAGLLAEKGSGTFGCRELGNSEEGNLHSLEISNDGHEDNEKDDGKSGLDGGVLDGHGGITVEKGGEDHCNTEPEDGERHENTSPVEGEGESSPWRLVGLDGLSSDRRENVLDQVGGVHDTNEFNNHGNVYGENSEVVVHVVNHHMGGVDLGGELTNRARQSDGGETNIEEDELDHIGKSEHINLRVKWRAALVDDEHDQEHHELASHQITVQIISLEYERGILVSDGVAIFVEIRIDWGETDHRSLRTFDHGKPADSEDTHDESNPWIGFLGNASVTREHEGRNDDDGKS